MDATQAGGNQYELAKGCCVSITTDGADQVHFGTLRDALGGSKAGVKFLSLNKVRMRHVKEGDKRHPHPSTTMGRMGEAAHNVCSSVRACLHRSACA